MDDDKNNQSLDGIKPTDDEPRVQKINISDEGEASDTENSDNFEPKTEEDNNQKPITSTEEQPEEKEPLTKSNEDTSDNIINTEDVTNSAVSDSQSLAQNTVATSLDQPTSAAPIASQETEIVKLKERNKSLKIWLVVFIVIFVAVATALVVYFLQNSKAQSDLDKQQAQNQQLQSQLSQQQQSATQTQINTLNTQITTLKQQNEALTKQVKAQSDYITTLTKTATQLKTTCGTACSSVVIPTPPPSATSATNTSSN